ncbi:hypothetical protein [Pteropox virus]|uniref:Uncharacterized protein n=1 Tax=Pteropox virus TaxID=1873698 RepID=A0A1B1MR90_9POXV|nr:hypothetical protein [Pteropox virus]ANS71088.1 hypothetical protein [Pteropox virus]
MAGYITFTLSLVLVFAFFDHAISARTTMHSSICVVKYPSESSKSLTVRFQAKVLTVRVSDGVYWSACGSRRMPRKCTFTNDNQSNYNVKIDVNSEYIEEDSFTYHHSLTSELTVFDVEKTAPVYTAKYLGLEVKEHVVDVWQVVHERNVKVCVEESSELFWRHERIKKRIEHSEL